MGIREMMDRHRLATTVAAALVVVLAVAAIAYNMPEPPPPLPPAQTNSFYTIDDGQTWFRGPLDRPVPFEHEGKQAVRAHVYRCGGKEFVGYMDRYTPEAMKLIEETEARVAAAATRPAGGRSAARRAEMIRTQTSYRVSMYGRELKRPGDTEWVRANDFAMSRSISQPTCPHSDPSHTPEPVVP